MIEWYPHASKCTSGRTPWIFQIIMELAVLFFIFTFTFVNCSDKQLYTDAELIEIIKADRCGYINRKFLIERANKPFRFPVDLSGLDRYPLHVAIDYKAENCILLILSEAADKSDVLLLHEDRVKSKAIEHGIKNFPKLATRFLPPNLSNEEVKKYVDLSMKEMPYQNVEFLVDLATKALTEFEDGLHLNGVAIGKVLLNLTEMDDDNPDITSAFLAYFLDRIGFANMEFSEEVKAFLFSLYVNAIKKKCKCIIESKEIYDKIRVFDSDVIEVIVEHADPQTLTTFLNFMKTKYHSDTFNEYRVVFRNAYIKKKCECAVYKYGPEDFNILRNEEVNATFTESDFSEANSLAEDAGISHIQTEAECPVYNYEQEEFNRRHNKELSMALSNFDIYAALPLVFDAETMLSHFPPEIMDYRESMYKGFTADQKQNLLIIIRHSEYIYGKIPFALVVAIHYTDWTWSMYDTRPDIFTRPISAVDPTTPIDLIACYAPNSYFWGRFEDISKKALDFILSDKCETPVHFRAQSMKTIMKRAYVNRMEILRKYVGPETSFNLFKASLIDLSSDEMLEVVRIGVEKKNPVFSLKAAKWRKLPVPFAVISELLGISGVNLKIVIELTELGVASDETAGNVRIVHEQLLKLLISDRNNGLLNVLIPRLWILPEALKININEPPILTDSAPTDVSPSLFHFVLRNHLFDLLTRLCKLEELEISAHDLELAVSLRETSKEHNKFADYAADKRSRSFLT